jgi:hypothetical protein
MIPVKRNKNTWEVGEHNTTMSTFLEHHIKQATSNVSCAKFAMHDNGCDVDHVGVDRGEQEVHKTPDYLP